MSPPPSPLAHGGATGLNLATWALVQIPIVGKMRCLFSMVFGASMILLTSRAEEQSGTTAADIYYRRNLWLLLFGIAHWRPVHRVQSRMAWRGGLRAV